VDAVLGSARNRLATNVNQGDAASEANLRGLGFRE